MKSYFCCPFLVLVLMSPISIAALEDSGSDLEGVPAEPLILKDEEPLKVNPRLSPPQKNVNLRSVQMEVLSIALPEESPEETEVAAPVEE